MHRSELIKSATMTTIGQSVIMNLDAGRLQDLLRKGKLQANSLADMCVVPSQTTSTYIETMTGSPPPRRVHLFSIKGVRRIDKAIITYRGDGKDRGEPWDAPMIVNVVYTVLASLKDGQLRFSSTDNHMRWLISTNSQRLNGR